MDVILQEGMEEVQKALEAQGVDVTAMKAALAEQGADLDAILAAVQGGSGCIRHIQRGTFSMDDDTSATTINLSGFTDLSKMMVLINGNRVGANDTSTTYPGRYAATLAGVYLYKLSLDALEVRCPGNTNYAGSASGSYQVIEFY